MEKKKFMEKIDELGVPEPLRSELVNSFHKNMKQTSPKKKNVKATPKIVWEDAVGAEQKKASTSSKRKRAEEPAAVAAEPASSVPVAAGGEAPPPKVKRGPGRPPKVPKE